MVSKDVKVQIGVRVRWNLACCLVSSCQLMDGMEPHCTPHLMVNPELFGPGEYERQSELAHQLIGRGRQDLDTHVFFYRVRRLVLSHA